MPDIESIRGEIQRLRIQVQRQRREIIQLQRARKSTTSADALLDRMLKKVSALRTERDRLKEEQPGQVTGSLALALNGIRRTFGPS